MKWLVFEKSFSKHESQYTVPTTIAEGSLKFSRVASEIQLNIRMR